jgi:hypothetical protein
MAEPHERAVGTKPLEHSLTVSCLVPCI